MTLVANRFVPVSGDVEVKQRVLVYKESTSAAACAQGRSVLALTQSCKCPSLSSDAYGR